MKRNFYRWIVYCLCIPLTGLVSCYEDIEVYQFMSAPKVVLNSMVIADMPILVNLSRTWFRFNDRDSLSINDAEVELYINGQFKEKMTGCVDSTEKQAGLYLSLYKPKQGDEICIKAKAEGFDPVEGTDLIPSPVELKDFTIETNIRNTSYSENRHHIFNITFQDDPNEDNYYFFFLEEGFPEWDNDKGAYTGEISWVLFNNVDYKNEPLFTGKITALDRIFTSASLMNYSGRSFTDEMIVGREYTLHVEATTSHSFEADPYSSYYPSDWSIHDLPENERLPLLARVTLYSVSEPFYKYLSSFLNLYDGGIVNELGSIGMAEPVRVFSNISGGVGILGGCHANSLTTELGSYWPQSGQ